MRRHALAAAIAEAVLRDQRLVVVDISKGDAYVDKRFATGAQLTSLDTRLSALDLEHEIRQTVEADVADAVHAVVRDVDATLLVIGLRRRTPVGKMLMGSVAQRLLLKAPCPVLAVQWST